MSNVRRFLQVLLLFVLALAPVSCSQPSDPLTCFDVLWHDFDWRYGQFEVKHVDWDDIRARYRSTLTAHSTDDELFTVLSGVLAELNDGHIVLYGDGRRFRSGITGQLGKMTDFAPAVIKDHYLAEPMTAASGSVTYGRLSATVGFVHIAAMKSQAVVNDVDVALAALADSAGLVVDVRGNPGGSLDVSTALAGRFADQKRLALRIRMRSGPLHSDLSSPTEVYVSPTGGQRFAKPVVLLTNRFSASAAELFTLMMRLFPNVTHVGDVTAGAQSTPILRELPNGWHYELPLGLTTDDQDRCYEGIGITPQILVANSPDLVEQGIDEALAMAVSRLEK